MNSSLYDRKAVVPDTLLKHLEQCFNSANGDENTEGHKRNKELRDSKVATYQQIKRIMIKIYRENSKRNGFCKMKSLETF